MIGVPRERAADDDVHLPRHLAGAVQHLARRKPPPLPRRIDDSHQLEVEAGERLRVPAATVGGLTQGACSETAGHRHRRLLRLPRRDGDGSHG